MRASGVWGCSRSGAARRFTQNGTTAGQRQYISRRASIGIDGARGIGNSAQKVEVRSAYIREEQPMTRVQRITRRRSLKVAAGSVGAALPLVHVQTAAAAGKLAMGVWDHWVPAAVWTCT